MNPNLRCALALALCVLALPATAATRYVTDELRISVRTGQGNQYRIVEVIGSGTRVESLGQEGEWTRIRTPEGNEGWVRAQYLIDRPVAADRLEETRQELEAARERIAELESSLAEVREARNTAEQRVSELQQEKAALEEEVAKAQRGLELQDENERLARRVERLKSQVSNLESEAERLADQSRKEWFLIGGGVLLGGILFGIIVTRIPWRSRRDRMF